jgi:tRNA-2-methylthio-N6-dimethylallyladenosine synthase
MADVLGAAQGYEQTQDIDEADLVVFNTCSVREKAQEKVFSDLGRVKHLKQKGVQIAVGGCVASQEGEAIIARAPYVDVVFGPQTLHRLPELLNQRRDLKKPQVDISFPEIEKFDHLPPARVEGASAFVSIMEGCSKYCSYCVVPYTRGEEINRPLDDVLTEVAGLTAQGVKEITLLGQNVNAYRGSMGSTSEIADFALLIEYIADIPGVERIRYTTSHPNEFTQRLIDVYAKVPQLVSHLHLPVQHGSDRILMAMKRGYTAMEYKSTIRKLRAVRPINSAALLRDAPSTKMRCTVPNRLSPMRRTLSSTVACRCCNRRNFTSCAVSSCKLAAGVPGRGLKMKLNDASKPMSVMSFISLSKSSSVSPGKPTMKSELMAMLGRTARSLRIVLL